MTAQALSPRLGVVLSTVTAGPPQDFVAIGRLAEAQGFAAVFVNEGRGDALACAQAIATGTTTLTVGTNIATSIFVMRFSPPPPVAPSLSSPAGVCASASA